MHIRKKYYLPLIFEYFLGKNLDIIIVNKGIDNASKCQTNKKDSNNFFAMVLWFRIVFSSVAVYVESARHSTYRCRLESTRASWHHLWYDVEFIKICST